MPDETAFERPTDQPPAPTRSGPRPPMAAHWPTPPGGWQPDRPADEVLSEGGASTKSDLGSSVGPASSWPGSAGDWSGSESGSALPSESGAGRSNGSDREWVGPDASWTASAASGDPGPADPFPNGPQPFGAGPSGPTGPPPIGGAVPERSRPKHLPLILSVIAGIVMIGLLTGIAFASVAAVHRYRQDRKLTTVGMQQPVRDGAFQFTADNVRCGVDEIGPPDDYQSPTGQFCVVTLTIKNVGTNPAIFADAIQKAYGPNGVSFGSDSEAAFYANPDPNVFFNDVNPGNKIKALVVYDIPPSERILRLEVHENPNTRGAIIKMG